MTVFDANGNAVIYQLIMQVAIASYDQAVDDQMRLEVVNNDGQTMAGCSGNGKTFSGRQTRQTRMSTSTSTNGDSFDGFTYVSGFTLKKLKHIPEFFQDFRFDTIYNELFKLFNNNNNNNNDLGNITLDSIATESAPNIWFINKDDVIINPSQTLVIDKGVTVTSFYNIINNGKFTNEGTFCIAKKNFTNNADFNNNGGTTLIYLDGTLNNSGRIDNKSGGKIINLQSTYEGNGVVVGNPLVTLTY
jgi:hypothetical protein